MLKNILLFLAISTSFMLEISCTHKHAEKELEIINHANSLLAADSVHEAMEILQKDSIQFINKPEHITMLYQLTRYRAMDQNFITLTDDSMMTQVEMYFAQKGNTNEQTLARYLLAACYRDMALYTECQKWANKAEEEADTLNANFNFDLFYKICCLRAEVFLFKFDNEMSLEDYYRAAYYAKKSHNKLKMTEALCRAGYVYIIMGKYEKAKDLLKNCISLYEECNTENTVFVSTCLLKLAQVELAQHHPKEAGRYLAEVEKRNHGETANNAFLLQTGLCAYLPHKGEWYELVNDYQSALFCSRREYALGGDYQGYACYGMAQRFYKLGKPDSAFIYMNQYALFRDSIQKEERAKELQAYQIHFKTMCSRQQIEKAKREKDTYSILFLFACAFIITGVAFGFTFYAYKKKKMTQLKTDFSIISAELEMIHKQKEDKETSKNEKSEKECGPLIEKLEKAVKHISKEQESIKKANVLMHKLRNSVACCEFYKKVYKHEKIGSPDIVRGKHYPKYQRNTIDYKKRCLPLSYEK